MRERELDTWADTEVACAHGLCRNRGSSVHGSAPTLHRQGRMGCACRVVLGFRGRFWVEGIVVHPVLADLPKVSAGETVAMHVHVKMLDAKAAGPPVLHGNPPPPNPPPYNPSSHPFSPHSYSRSHSSPRPALLNFAW